MIKNRNLLGGDKFKGDSLADRQRLAGCPAEAVEMFKESSNKQIQIHQIQIQIQI